MQRSLLSLLLAVFLIPSMQCGSNETLDLFNGRMVVTTIPFSKNYKYAPGEYQYFYHILNDSLKWIYEYPPVGESRVSLILSGQIKTDTLDDFGDTIFNVAMEHNHIYLSVMSKQGELSGAQNITPDVSGKFLDTVQVAVSTVPGIVLPCTTALYINIDNDITDTLRPFITDTVQFLGPHPALQGEEAP